MMTKPSAKREKNPSRGVKMNLGILPAQGSSRFGDSAASWWNRYVALSSLLLREARRFVSVSSVRDI